MVHNFTVYRCVCIVCVLEAADGAGSGWQRAAVRLQSQRTSRVDGTTRSGRRRADTAAVRRSARTLPATLHLTYRRYSTVRGHIKDHTKKTLIYSKQHSSCTRTFQHLLRRKCAADRLSFLQYDKSLRKWCDISFLMHYF